MYANRNFQTKKALKEAVAAGRQVTYYQPGPFGGNETQNGRITLEGPHGFHRWWAECTVKDGVIIKVK